MQLSKHRGGLAEAVGLISQKFGGEPDWLVRLRVKWFEQYKILPPETSELYIRHHISPEFDEDRLFENLDGAGPRGIPSDFKRVVEDTEHPTAVFVGKNLVHLSVPTNYLNVGVELLGIKEAVRRHESFFKDLYGRVLTSPYSDKYTYLAHALHNAGVFIRIPKNAELEKPFRIVYVLDRENEAVYAKAVVVCGPGSRSSVVEEFHGLPGTQGCVIGHHADLITDIDCSLKHSILQNLGHEHLFTSNRVFDIGMNSSATAVGALIGGGTSKARIDSVLAGNGSSVNDLEIVFGDGEQSMDLTANLHHLGYGTAGRVVAKGVVKEKAKTIFKGVITIEKAAKNTSAYLAEHAMIMSPEARAYAIPSLEIKTDEVKATHSASVSQIDPEQVYYLMTRGIPQEEARKMLALGFFEPVVSMVDLDEVRWGIRSLLEGKWGGPVTELFEEPEVTITSLFGTHYKYRYGR
jgi:FeS assembly protein SufD